MGEDGASKGRSAIKDDVAGKFHGNVPEGHELGFGPVGTKAESFGAEAEEKNEDGASTAEVTEDEGAVIEIEFEVN